MDGSSGFSAIACEDPADQARRLRDLLPGHPLLELSPMRAKSVIHRAATPDRTPG